VLGAVFRIFGPSFEATMLVPWFLGALAIVPAYFLGKELGSSTAGGIAGLLLATSPAHTVISSHVPWVHSVTPLLATCSLWLMVRACKRHEPRSLVIAGLLVGVTLQTHPTAFPLLMGAGLATAFFMRLWQRPLLPALFLTCMVIGYAPLLVHHLQTHFAVVDDIDGKKARYLDADPDPDESGERGVYLNNLEQLASSLVRLSAGELQEKHATAGGFLTDVRLVVYPALGLLGLLVTPRRLSWILLAGLIAAVLLPPILNGKYRPILDGRYLMPLVPVMFVGIGCLAAKILNVFDRQRIQPLVAVMIALTSAGLALSSMSRLDAFYEESTEDGASNQLYLRTLNRIRDEHLSGEAVWLDPRLREVKMPAGDSAGSTFAWLLPVSGIPIASSADDAYSAAASGHLLILQRATAQELRQRLALNFVDDHGSNSKNSPSYRLVRAKPS
jgi:hypothetical protein